MQYHGFHNLKANGRHAFARGLRTILLSQTTPLKTFPHAISSFGANNVAGYRCFSRSVSRALPVHNGCIPRDDETLDNSLKVYRRAGRSQGHELYGNGFRPRVGERTIKTELIYNTAYGRNSISKISLRRTKRSRQSPAECLKIYLRKDTSPAMTNLWDHLRSQNPFSSALPTILMRYMYAVEHPEEVDADPLRQQHQANDIRFLANSAYSMDDVHHWAWVVRASNNETRVNRYLAAASKAQQPTFLLLHILSFPDMEPKILQRVLVHCWNTVLGRSVADPEDLAYMSEEQIKDTLLIGPVVSRRSKMINSSSKLPIEYNSFMIMFSRLAHRARETWPHALISISHLMSAYLDLIKRTSDHKNDLVHARKAYEIMSRLFNAAILRLALPSKVNPLMSMHLNWQSQQILLNCASVYERPLIINRSSYRAVGTVLAASKKSSKERTYAGLMLRTWPPWRKEIDGMDVLRPREDDLSRVYQTNSMMKEAGYQDDTMTRTILVIGGREVDQTPSIQTRRLIKRQKDRPSKQDKEQQLLDMWPARVLATRDVREAWSAFCALPQGIRPSMLMYLAMFEKIDNEYKRQVKGDTPALPGDGREVVTWFDDNLSESELERSKPPSLGSLYSRMLRQGLKPSGRCLEYLVSHARTLPRGTRYLTDSDLDPRAVAMLVGYEQPNHIIKSIPRQIVTAYIRLVCRLVRPTPSSPQDAATGLDTVTIGGQHYLRRTQSVPGHKFARIARNPLLHALETLKRYNSPFRPAWYALFRALAQEKAVINPKLFGTPENDVLAFQILEAAFLDAQKLGLSLDPHGFKIFCNGMEKALLAKRQMESDGAQMKATSPHDLYRSLRYLKDKFREFSSSVEGGTRTMFLPKLLYNLEAAHLHAYARVLGLAGEYEEILELARWMKRFQAEIADAALESRAGMKLLRRILISMRTFVELPHEPDNAMHPSTENDDARGKLEARMGDLGGKKAAEAMSHNNGDSDSGDAEKEEKHVNITLRHLRSEIESLEGWGGWPSDEEVEAYLFYRRDGSAEAIEDI